MGLNSISNCPSWQIPHMVLTSCAARCIEGKHSLDGNIHGRDIKGLEHDLQGRVQKAVS